MEYKLQPFFTKYIDSLVSLLDQSFHILVRDKKKLIQWKFFDPYLQSQTVTYLALDNEDTVVSQYTNIPYAVTAHGKVFRSMNCVDMTTSPEHRRKGLISKLASLVYKEVTAKKKDFTIGFSNQEGIVVDQHAKNYGYKIVGKFETYFSLLIKQKKCKMQLVPTNRFSQTFLFTSSKYFQVNKVLGFLNWRYLHRPENEYQFFQIIQQSELVGYVVLRFHQRKCYVYDIILRDREKTQIKEVIRAIENISLQHSKRIVIFTVLDNSYWQKIFRECLYLKKRHNRGRFYLTIKIHNQSMPTTELLNKENWLLMSGDIL